MADEDRDIWDSAIAESKPPATEQPVTDAVKSESQPAEQPRDEQGRFAAKASEQPPPEQITAADVQPPQRPQQRSDDQAAIPTWRLREEAEARRAAEQRAVELQRQAEQMQVRLRELETANQPKTEPPDIFDNPAGYQSHIQQTFEQRMREQEINFSFRLAHREYKMEFEQAYQALLGRRSMGDMATVHSIVQSSDPGEALVKWHRQQKLYEATNGDLEGYIAKQRDSMLNDPEFLAKAAERIRAQNSQQQSRPPVTQLPPSLNKLSPAAPTLAEDEDMSDAGLLKAALRR